MAVRELQDNEHGRSVHKRHKADKAFSKAYREEQTQFLPGSGAAGLDEMVSTETVNTLRAELAARFTPRQVEEAVGRLSEERELVGLLAWPSGESDRPIGAHPGGLSKSQTDMRRGLTAGHGSRNIERADAVTSQFHAAISAGKPLGTVLEETATMGLLMAANRFMVPRPELESVDVSGAEKDAFHPMFGAVIEDQERTSAFDRYSAAVHDNRERRKMELAQRLIELGYEGAVAPEMVAALEDTDWEDAIVALGREEGPPDYGPPQSRVVLPPNPTLEGLHRGNIRAVSPPRSLSKPKFKGQ